MFLQVLQAEAMINGSYFNRRGRALLIPKVVERLSPQTVRSLDTATELTA